jgi:hypothetical protein
MYTRQISEWAVWTSIGQLLRRVLAYSLYRVRAFDFDSRITLHFDMVPSISLSVSCSLQFICTLEFTILRTQARLERERPPY